MSTDVEGWMDSVSDLGRINLTVELLSCNRLMAEACTRMAYELISRQREPMAGDAIRIDFAMTRDQASEALAAIRRAMNHLMKGEAK